MKILFCNIAWMDYYKGVTKTDRPKNGGAWVKDNDDAHEANNFQKMKFDGEDTEYCLGFFETKSTNGQDRNQLHIEKIQGCELCKYEDSVDDVLVIWYAKDDCVDFTSVIGWYKHTTVLRYHDNVKMDSDYDQYYNVIAKSEDCVLLPKGIRHRRALWYVPRKGKKNGLAYGFGQANVWFGNTSEDNQNLNNYLKKIVEQIEGYCGENWVEKYLD